MGDEVNCFFGIVTDSEVDPESEWDRVCEVGDTENCIVTCVGDRPACYKVRLGKEGGRFEDKDNPTSLSPSLRRG